jgi:hypothetical protein
LQIVDFQALSLKRTVKKVVHPGAAFKLKKEATERGGPACMTRITRINTNCLERSELLYKEENQFLKFV